MVYIYIYTYYDLRSLLIEIAIISIYLYCVLYFVATLNMLVNILSLHYKDIAKTQRRPSDNRERVNLF